MWSLGKAQAGFGLHSPLLPSQTGCVQCFARNERETGVIPSQRRKSPATPSTRFRGGLRRPSAAFKLLVCVALASHAISTRAQTPPLSSSDTAAHSIVVGFLGGFVRSNDTRRSEVQLANKLRSDYNEAANVRVFSNWHRGQAHKYILRLLREASGGNDSPEARQNAHIVLYGHSWGASAAIILARKLQREGIPVLLTIQVDSIAKIGQNDRVVPTNVKQAINFYQRRGILRGRSAIVAADASHTEILGNLRFQYKQLPAECRSYPWYARHLFKGHTAIECDPRVWSQIDTLIRDRLPLTESNPIASAPDAANSADANEPGPFNSPF